MKAILIIPCFVLLITAFFLYDKINKFQYQNYRKEWERNGQAGGFFWNAPESKFFAGSLTRSIRLLSWTFGNETWMKNEPKIIRTALIMRLCVFAFWLFIFSMLILNVS